MVFAVAAEGCRGCMRLTLLDTQLRRCHLFLLGLARGYLVLLLLLLHAPYLQHGGGCECWALMFVRLECDWVVAREHCGRGFSGLQ